MVTIKELIKRVFMRTTCCHTWNCIRKTKWYDHDFGNTWFTEIWVCKKCGKVKRIKL